MPVTNTITKSKCYNKRTKLPDYDKASSFSTCTKCIHLLSSTGCKEDLNRMGISLTRSLDEFPFPTNSIRDKYVSELKKVDRMLKEINKIEDNCND